MVSLTSTTTKNVVKLNTCRPICKTIRDTNTEQQVRSVHCYLQYAYKNSSLPTAFIREAIDSYYKNCVLLPVRTEPTVVKRICRFCGGVLDCHSNLS